MSCHLINGITSLGEWCDWLIHDLYMFLWLWDYATPVYRRNTLCATKCHNVTGDYKGTLQVSPKVLFGLAYFKIRICHSDCRRGISGPSAFGLRGYVDNTLPSRCYASPRWILRVRRKFFKLLHSPTVASEPGLCIDVICTSRTQRVVADNSHTA